MHLLSLLFSLCTLLVSLSFAAPLLQGNILAAVAQNEDSEIPVLSVINVTTGTLVEGVSFKLSPPLPSRYDQVVWSNSLYDATTTSYCYTFENTFQIYCLNIDTSKITTVTVPKNASLPYIWGIQSYQGVIFGMAGNMFAGHGASVISFFSVSISFGQYTELLVYEAPENFYLISSGVGYAQINNVDYVFATLWDSNTGYSYWLQGDLSTKKVTLNTNEDCSVASVDTIANYNNELFGVTYTDLMQFDIKSCVDESDLWNVWDNADWMYKIGINAIDYKNTMFYTVSVEGKGGKDGLYSWNWKTQKSSLIVGQLDVLQNLTMAAMISF